MKKSIFYYLFAVVCTVCLFTACSDDDDNGNKPLTVDDIVGTYIGTLEVLGNSMPNTPISVTKVSDSKVAVGLKDFKFGSIEVGDITVECNVTPDTKDNELNLNGSGTVMIAALGDISLPVVIDGDANATKLDIDINITNIPGIGNIKVEYEGTK